MMNHDTCIWVQAETKILCFSDKIHKVAAQMIYF